MKHLVEHIARALVDYPDQVVVQQVETERSMVLELRVDPADIGKVIGKQGKIVKAIRTVVGAAAVKANKRVMVEIVRNG